MSFFTNFLRRFMRDEKGTVLIETLVVLPLFLWAFAALFAYWDAYRNINTVQKASYTVADLISRNQVPVDDAYIGGMLSTLNYVMKTENTGKMRVTSFKWNDPDKRYEVIFSRSPNQAMPQLTNNDLANLKSRLPIMANADSAVLVEVDVPYTPPVNYGLAPGSLTQFIVTRPRLIPKLCHVNVAC